MVFVLVSVNYSFLFYEWINEVLCVSIWLLILWFNIQFLLSSWDKTYVTCNNGKFFPRDPMLCIGAMPAGIIRKCCVNLILEDGCCGTCRNICIISLFLWPIFALYGLQKPVSNFSWLRRKFLMHCFVKSLEKNQLSPEESHV